MVRRLTISGVLLGAMVLGFGLTEAAQAQGTAMPAGRAPATAPGGTMGKAGPANVQRAIRRGQAYRGYRRMRRR